MEGELVAIFFISEPKRDFDYSDLPNNHAANLINFWGKNTYTNLLGPIHSLISEVFPSKPDFHLFK